MHFRRMSKISQTALAAGLICIGFSAPQSAWSQENSDNQNLTIEDLEGFINLPSSAQLRRESDEDLTNPRDVFSNEALRQEYLGNQPDYVYIPEGVDPMIIPWIRNQIVAGELMQDARDAFSRAQETGDVLAAQSIVRNLEEISTKYPDAPQIADAQSLVEEISNWILGMQPKDDGSDDNKGPEIVEPAPITPNLPLPSWVKDNTTGVIVDTENPEDSVVLVGDFILREGESLVDRYAGVSVKEIAAQQVIYEYNNREHAVIVESN